MTLEDMAKMVREESSLKVYRFGCEGISSLLMHNPAAMDHQDSGKKTNVKNIPTPEEEAERSTYRDGDGTLYLPSNMFRSSLWNGAAYRKIGREAARNIINAGVFNVDSKTPVLDPETMEVYRDFTRIHTVRAVIENKGIRRSRAEIEPWYCVVCFELDREFLSPEIVEELLNIAGKRSGVGDWRPQKKGPHGRFRAILLGEEK